MNSITTLMLSHNTDGRPAAYEGDDPLYDRQTLPLPAIPRPGELALAGGTVRVFEQDFTLEDAIGSHAC
jgi:hypothetical protein